MGAVHGDLQELHAWIVPLAELLRGLCASEDGTITVAEAALTVAGFPATLLEAELGLRLPNGTGAVTVIQSCLHREARAVQKSLF